MLGTVLMIGFILFLIIGFIVFSLYNAETYRTTYPQCMSQYLECPEYKGFSEAFIKKFLQEYSCQQLSKDGIIESRYASSQECRDVQIKILEKIKST